MSYRRFEFIKSIAQATVYAFASVTLISGCSCASGSDISLASEASSEVPIEQAEATPITDDSNGLNLVDGCISRIFIQKNTNGADDGVERLIKLMEENGQPFYRTAQSPEGIIASDDIVILKINCQWDKRGGTNTDLIKSVAKAISAHPDSFTGEVIVADNGQKQFGSRGVGGSLDWDDANSLSKDQSALDVVNELKDSMNISGSLWDEITMNKVAEYDTGDMEDGFVVEEQILPAGLEVSYPKFESEYGRKISFKRGVWDEANQAYEMDRLKIINMPVLKTHALFQVTGAIKSYMGTTASKLTGQRSHNSVSAGGMGAQMAGSRVPALNIMDMIWIGSEHGPGIIYENASETDMIAASTDPVALDFWCAKNVLIPEVSKDPMGAVAALDPSGTSPGIFGHWLRLSMDELNKAGFKATMDEAKMEAFMSE
ncbi:MAG: DUF362 domain-containing protein [Clostridiales bacterium]|jgi:hypothetical protein|nr:DUF362 domain-containing protein [Clostridiales bacterium]